jgi:amidohydrolase
MKSILTLLASGLLSLQIQSQAQGLNNEIIKSAASLTNKYQTLYQDLHRNPELSFMEFRTSEKMAVALRAMGFEVTTGFGGNGVIGVFRNGAGKVIMLRTDMDALPVKENTGLSFSSTVIGKNSAGTEFPVMHACGHDLHMSVWLGTLETLVTLRKNWKGTIIAVAEPAEEVSGGSDTIIKSGLFNKFPRPDAIMCYHVSPEIPAGTIGYCTGPVLAGVGSSDITVFGIGGHGAMPHKTIDPIVLASRIVLDLQTIVSRETNPVKPAVVTVGAINGGTKNNIIPEEVKLLLSLRYFDDAVYDHIKEAISRIVKGDAIAAGLPENRMPLVKFSSEATPPVINNEALAIKAAGFMKDLLGENNVIKVDPVMVAEDFGRYGRTEEKIPISLFWLGGVSKNKYNDFLEKGTVLPYLHSSMFVPDFEPSFKCGVEAMSKAAIEIFKEK